MTVGLVLVCHSAQLGGGLAEVIAQTAPAVPVRVAAGTGAGRLGTSAPAIVLALRECLQASDGDGVLVLFDFGSGFMALEAALEELDPAERRLVSISGAPFVEGALMAAVEAAAGFPLSSVAAAAERAASLPKLPGS
jgi:PTS hybrid protein